MSKNKIISILFVLPLLFFSCKSNNTDLQPKQIVILHTNDTHSQVDPYKNEGGYEARYKLIDSLRQEHPNLILLDAGDIFQGTPYFNLFNGRVEIGAYNIMKYDAMTLGNHEFDLGLDTLANRIREAKFPIVVSNYDVSNTPLNGLVKPYLILERNGVKIGIIGLGVNPENLILEKLYGNVKYEDPIAITNKLAAQLKKEGCDVVVVLSHLGFNNDHGDPNVTDSILATQISNVDLILGGHTHNVAGEYEIANQEGKEIIVAQEGKAGRKLYKYTITIK